MIVPYWLSILYYNETDRDYAIRLMTKRKEIGVHHSDKIDQWIAGDTPDIDGCHVLPDSIGMNGEIIAIKHYGKVFYSWPTCPFEMPIDAVATTCVGALYDIEMEPRLLLTKKPQHDFSRLSIIALPFGEKLKFVASKESIKGNYVIVTKRILDDHNIMPGSRRVEVENGFVYIVDRNTFVKEQLMHGDISVIPDDYVVKLPKFGFHKLGDYI